MLRELVIRNLAVVEEARVPLGAGFNVLTGETGAGKSIVVDALLLVVGGRAHPDLIRSGEAAAVVEAVFDVPASGPVAAVLDEAGHSLREGQLVIRREVARSGRHRVWVNDTAATVGLLERLGEHLVEVHGQHEHQRLLVPARQLDLLDRFAGADARREHVGALVARWQAARAERDLLAQELREAARQEDLHRFQLAEIDAVRLDPGEEERLREERTRASHAERIRTGLEEALGHLTDDAQSAGARLGRAAAVLRALARVERLVEGPLAALDAATAQIEDAVGALRILRDRPGFEPERLAELDDRLHAITRLKRKYGDSEAAILVFRDEVAAALERMNRGDALIADVERRLERAAAEAGQAAAALSAARADAAARLGRQLQAEVRGLGMEAARVEIALGREPAGPGELAAEGGSRLGPRGAESAEILLSANPGEEPKPLAKVVSGGELSRTMLAVRSILAAVDAVPTLVFDEVDAGVGGRVADVVGQRLSRTAAAGRQVICVTHLAPIAAHAAHHMVVDKRAARGVTRTSVTTLDEAARVDELARMLTGERVSDASRRHARELLRTVRAAR